MLTKAEIKSVYSPTPMQLGILKNAFFSPNSYAQQTQLILPLKGSIDLLLFEHCWQEAVNRHDALRSHFIHNGIANPVQTIPYYEVLHIKQYQVESGFNPISHPTSFPAEIKNYLANDLIQPFDLESTHPMRLAIFSLASEHHWLVWTFHKVFIDHQSINIILKEVFESYNAFKASASYDSNPNNSLCHYAQWLGKQNRSKALTYWKKQLHSFDDSANLLLFRKPHHQTHIQTSLDKKLVTELYKFEHDHDSSLYNILLSAWALNVGHYLDQQDVIVPIILSGRTTDIEVADQMVGLFTNVVPIRITWNNETTFTKLLKVVQSNILDAQENQYVSISDIHSVAKHLPIDHLFEVEEPILKDVIGKEFFGIEVFPPIINENAAESLKLSITVKDSDISLHIVGNHDESWLHSMIESYLHILSAVVHSAYKTFKEIDLMDANQRHLLLAWGDGGPSPTHGTLLESFDDQLSKMPDAPAITANGISISYFELETKANHLANSMLKDYVFSYDCPIAIISHRNIETIVGLLAILKTGTAYLMIDPDLPSEQIRLMLEQSGCQYILATSDILNSLVIQEGITKINFSALHRDVSCNRPHISVTPDDLAYCTFNSNPSNVSKCAMVQHKNISAFFAALPEAFCFIPGDRMLASTSFASDKAILELLGAICCGMTVILASEQQIENAESLLNLIRQQQVNVLQMTPLCLQSIIDLDKHKALASVHTLLVGGANLSTRLAHQLLAYKDIRVFYMYGCPETTIWSTYWPIAEGPVRIGRPLPGERIFILSPQNRIQPPGAIGQIAIAGSGVCAGYLYSPRQTSENFITLPNIDGPVYLTGDLGYWRRDGSLELVGKRESQIKTRCSKSANTEKNYHYKRTEEESGHRLIGIHS